VLLRQLESPFVIRLWFFTVCHSVYHHRLVSIRRDWNGLAR